MREVLSSFFSRQVCSLRIANSCHTRSRLTMTETFTGLMLPLIAGSLPDFLPVFTRYPADLKRAAEANA
jgi:hypothetical protein